MEYLRREEFRSATVSFEMTLAQIRDLGKQVPAEAIVYGRLPLMMMENCVMKGRSGVCTCEGGVTKLVNRRGEEFPLIKDAGTCRNVLLNGKKLYTAGQAEEVFQNLGLWALRLQFPTENDREVDQILHEYASGGNFHAGCLHPRAVSAGG